MKVLFTGLFPFWQCHIVGECNFVEEHLTAGDEVEILTCEASLGACDANPEHELANCMACMGIRQNAIAMLSKSLRFRSIVSNSAKKKIQRVKVPFFQSMEELKSFHCFDAPAGSDVISSVMTATGDPNFDTMVHAEIIKQTIIDYLGVYLTAQEYLQDGGYSLVYLFNGRFAPAKAWIRACETKRIDYFTLERLGMPDRILKIKNGTVHGLSSYSQWINEFWAKHQNDPEVRKEAVDFFEERPKGLMTGWYSFVAGQDHERLPEGWDSEKRNVAIFSSTETEFAGIPEVFTGALYADQRSCYLRIAQLLRERNPLIHLNLRIHPNSKSEKKRWWEDREFSDFDNMTVIPPESTVSSYELMKSCEKTVVFMTTMGVEATYWGKPSILLSNSMYKGIGAVYEPTTEEECLRFILEENLKPKSREATLAYGGFLRMGYPQLPYSAAIDHCTLTFKGQRPNASPYILKTQWRWNALVKNAPVPKFLKLLWERFEWWRLSRSTKSVS